MTVPRVGMNCVTRKATSQLKVVHREEETAWTKECEEDERLKDVPVVPELLVVSTQH